ncbi:hypothetical protein [Paenibacillus spongiae]|uniref:Uncharacterized protein n=1 Tax=Paenibacillus spongiae TaxID=2909671 RepID=A0ABY5SMF0_9BACL|nr:hypothetical protein [Paenibacillus spongiae]UVI33403.1 hypothetical protein L1F29_16865 [Paenibacillus spongiae]
MSKKQKIIVNISIGLNILLISIAAWGYMKMKFVKEQIFIVEVQHNLVELEGLIAKQKEDNWSEPNLVTTELGDVLNGIWLGITTGEQLGTLSKSEKETLNNLYNKLKQFPNDELYRFADLTEEDKVYFEKLQEILREVGLGLRIPVSGSMKYFINQAEELEGKLRFHCIRLTIS